MEVLVWVIAILALISIPILVFCLLEGNETKNETKEDFKITSYSPNEDEIKQFDALFIGLGFEQVYTDQSEEFCCIVYTSSKPYPQIMREIRQEFLKLNINLPEFEFIERKKFHSYETNTTKEDLHINIEVFPAIIGKKGLIEGATSFYISKWNINI